MQIRYIGLKPIKQDNVANTGLSWSGAGDVREVTDLVAARKLLSYPLVWEEATDAEAAGGKAAAPNSEGDTGKTAVQKVAELDALRERAKALGIDFKATWGAPKLTKAIEDAEAAGGKAA